MRKRRAVRHERVLVIVSCLSRENKGMQEVLKLTFNKSCAEALFSGSTFSARCKKSLKIVERLCSSLMVGVPLVAIR